MNKKLLAKQAAIYNEIFSNMNGGPIGSIVEIIKKEKVKKRTR